MPELDNTVSDMEDLKYAQSIQTSLQKIKSQGQNIQDMLMPYLSQTTISDLTKNQQVSVGKKLRESGARIKISTSR